MRAGVADLCGRFQSKQHERVEAISQRESHVRQRKYQQKKDRLVQDVDGSQKKDVSYDVRAGIN